jgi:NAD(P)-dependent dehydrogenase (short-subunit alcohol dehydrogenase family)
VGSGSGLSASLARAFAQDGLAVSLAARNTDKLAELCAETGAQAFRCDTRQVEALFAGLDEGPGAPDVVVYNPSYRVRGPFVDLDPAEVQKTLQVSAFGGFLVARQAARRMLEKGTGVILFTGASASVKGYAESAPFAMGKFALRGLAQAIARELQPQGIHVCHVVIDGGIRNEARGYTGTPTSPTAISTPTPSPQTTSTW